jgi:hypothetical protein
MGPVCRTEMSTTHQDTLRKTQKAIATPAVAKASKVSMLEELRR